MRRLAAFAFALLVLAPAAQAATKAPVFGLRAVGNNQRGYFVYTVPAGASRTGAVIVSNVGTAAGTVKLFTSDATTGRTTGTVYETNKQPTKAGAWVKLSSTSVTLVPGAHKQVPFTVHVPAGTKPGEWVGGIVAETSHQLTSSKSKQKANVQIKIRDLTIVAVQSNVPGPRVSAFTIGKVTTGGQRGFQQLFVHFASNGNELVKPTGRVSVATSSGTPVETMTFSMDTFLPQTAIDYPVLLKKALAPGDYTANVTLRVPGGQVVTASPAFSVSQADVKQVFTSASPTQAPATTASSSSSQPWALIAAVAAVVVIVLFLLWLFLRRRKRRRWSDTPPETLHPSPATLAAAIAERRAPSEPEPAATPAEPVAPAAAPPPPSPAAQQVSERPAACTPFHFWEVGYDRGQLGGDGVWRFPHRCQNCGLELLASDVPDASAQADRLAPPA